MNPTYSVAARGDGPAVVLVPSLGRGAPDFDDLAARLADGGFRALPADPPRGFPGEPTLFDLAESVLRAVDGDRFHLVGHALGNRISRALTSRHPERVLSLTLLGAGGLVHFAPEVGRALAGCFDTSLPADEHLRDVRFAFFAPENDPSPWRGGWMPEVAAYQRAAVERTRVEDWWNAAPDRVLVVQGLQDVLAVPENGRRYVAGLGPRARLVEVDGAGHALLPEQPDAVAGALLAFLREG